MRKGPEGTLLFPQRCVYTLLWLATWTQSRALITAQQFFPKQTRNGHRSSHKLSTQTHTHRFGLPHGYRHERQAQRERGQGDGGPPWEAAGVMHPLHGSCCFPACVQA
eukprot:scaffold246418_cov17-Tisochrysis_lutea.AAC.2